MVPKESLGEGRTMIDLQVSGTFERNCGPEVADCTEIDESDVGTGTSIKQHSSK